MWNNIKKLCEVHLNYQDEYHGDEGMMVWCENTKIPLPHGVYIGEWKKGCLWIIVKKKLL